MTATPNPLSPLAVRDFLPLSHAQVRPVNESLLLEATARWNASREHLFRLTTDAPSVHASLKAFIHEQLGLDGDSVQLHFAATADQPARYVTLTQACAFVHQITVPASLYQHCRVVGLPEGKTQYAAQPLELVKPFTQLNVQQALRTAWVRYWWFTRAPGTPVSRRDHAVAQYSSHLQRSEEHTSELQSQ